MDEIKQRIKDAADNCLKAYEAWRGKSSDHALREALMEAVHEWRKVGARMEIELAVADRQQNPNDPIPIPSHRAARRGGPGAQGPADDIGNTTDEGGRNNRPNRPQQAPRPPRNSDDDSAPAAASTGGSGKPLSLKRSAPDAE